MRTLLPSVLLAGCAVGSNGGVFATLGDGESSSATSSEAVASGMSGSESGDLDTDGVSTDVETSSSSDGSTGSDASSSSSADSSGSVEEAAWRIGVFRPSEASWTLDDGDGSFDGCGVDSCLPSFGAGEDIPVSGDWSGTGTTAIGIFRPSDRTWTLDDGNGAFGGCGVDTCLGAFGAPGDIPVTGDWAGTGTTAIGVFRPSDATWTLDDGSGEFEDCNADTCLGAFGAAGDIPVTGDWTGTGATAIGVFRPSDATWTLDDGNGAWDGCGVDMCLGAFGAGGDIPVTGDWSGTGTTAIGVFRPSEAGWTLDDGNGTFDGCGVDTCVTFGAPGDLPISGRW